MNYRQYFNDELENEQTEYFILDTKGDEETGDIDFVKYSWNTKRFNKIKEGDLIIFRRPGTSSETKKFYFFGAAKLGQIEGVERVTGRLIKCYPFNDFIHQNDIENFNWTFKTKGENWEHFFNQYGMNKINKIDFEELLKISESDDELDKEPEAEAEATKDIQLGNYNVDDKEGRTKVRAKQQVFSNSVKTNYNNQCAICSIRTKEFLIASHIIPWSKRNDIRIKPSNGICLCNLHDKAFDKGFISLTDDLKVIITQINLTDQKLISELNKIKGMKIYKPITFSPEIEFLKYHRDNILRK